MKVEVRYATEFGSSATVIDVTDIPRFAKRFKMLSVKPYEENENETKQTAVKWLESCLIEQHPNGSFVWNTKADLKALFKQAIEMEKQQIIEAHGNQTKKSGGVTNYTYTLNGEDYYNETFNNIITKTHILNHISTQRKMEIPTAEQWLLKHKELSMYDVAEYDEGGYLGINEQKLYQIMIEFATMHVQACKQDIANNATVDNEPDYLGGEWSIVNTDSILNAYPESNIK